MPLTNINSDWMSNASLGLCIILLYYIIYIEQSNRTLRCLREFSAAGLPWLEHFRVQCYTHVKGLLVHFRKTRFIATFLATRPEVEGFRDQDFVLKIYK